MGYTWTCQTQDGRHRALQALRYTTEQNTREICHRRPRLPPKMTREYHRVYSAGARPAHSTAVQVQLPGPGLVDQSATRDASQALKPQVGTRAASIGVLLGASEWQRIMSRHPLPLPSCLQLDSTCDTVWLTQCRGEALSKACRNKRISQWFMHGHSSVKNMQPQSSRSSEGLEPWYMAAAARGCNGQASD